LTRGGLRKTIREGVATPEIEFIKGASPAFKKRSLTAPQRRKRHGDLRHALQFHRPSASQYQRHSQESGGGKQAAAQAGVTVKEVLWLQGQYDLLVISESSDEVTSAAFALNILKQGNLRGQTLRAITAAEMEKILEKTIYQKQ
jgi:uncharacterized protein with GYD domain